MASVDKNLGYLTSSFTILSKTSSSSSPGKETRRNISELVKMSFNTVKSYLFKVLKHNKEQCSEETKKKKKEKQNQTKNFHQKK